MSAISAFCDAYDAGYRQLLDTLSYIPDDQLVEVVRHIQDAHGIPRRQPYTPDRALSEPVADATGPNAPVQPRNAAGAHSAPNTTTEEPCN